MGIGLETDAAREAPSDDEEQRPESHHITGQHRGIDLHGPALAHTHDVTAIGNDPDDRQGDGSKGPHRTAFAEEAHHHQCHDQRIHEMDRRGHSAGDILVGYHQAQRRGGPENAQQEHRAQFAPAEAEVTPCHQSVGAQTERRHAPAVSQHLE